MKKLFTLAFALMGFAGAANAATVDDLEPLKHSYVLVCDELGERPGKEVLFGANHFLDVKGGTTATNKGQVDLSVVDALGEDGSPLYVTQEIVDKYGADYAGPHYNWLRLKNQQDMIALRLTAKSKIIIFEQGNNKVGKDARIPRISTDLAQANSLNEAPGEDHPATVSGFRWEFTVEDDGLYYLGSYNGDMFISFIIIEANEAPGTPAVKVGDQMFEGGLWFKEVSCTPRNADYFNQSFPTVITYTTDGSAPTAESPKYTEPIKCYSNQTLKFQAFLDFGGGSIDPEAFLDGADNEANVSFKFDAPTINAEGANVTITTPYEEGAKNFYKLNGGDAIEGSSVTLTESATVAAYTEITNGSYAVFKTNTTTKDVYVLNPIKEKKLIAVTAGDVVLDEEATAASTTGEVYKVEGGAISADKADFFVKNLTFAIVGDPQYQIDGKQVYIQMSNTNITFEVAEGDSVNVKVITAKNSCKTLNPDNDESVTTDRKNYVNVDGTTYGHDDVTEEGGNIIEFGLGAGIHTFLKYSGTGNILISSIEITPVAAVAPVEEIVLWEGEALVNGWANQPTFLSDAGAELAAAGAEVGDGLRIYATAPDDNWQVELTEGHWGGMYDRYAAKDLGPNQDGSERHYTIVDLASQGYFEYIITQEFLNAAYTQQWWGGVFLLNGDGNLTITKVTLAKGVGAGIENVVAKPVLNGGIYNLRGQKVDANYKGVVIVNGKKMLQK